MATLYPDVNHYHPVTDWAKVKANCPFLISKATQGTTFVDPTLASFIAGCEEYDIPYWLFTYLNAGNELAQAKFLVSTCQSMVGENFVGYILDAEKKNASANVQSALDYLDGLGIKTMVYHMYADLSLYSSLITARPTDCAWWEARYGKNDGSYNSEYPCHTGVELHQYTSLGSCPGVSGSCDLNRVSGSKAEEWFKTPLATTTIGTAESTGIGSVITTILVGSARIDENGKATGGTAGDQLQTGTDDMSGEVSMQAMYTHSKGWYILRPKSVSVANKMAELMKTACNNAHIGYDQNNRLGVVTYGINTTKDTECDCSSLVREVVKEATGIDPGNFTTANEATKLAATGLFNSKIAYVSQSSTPVYNGDVLVTKTKGHTVIVVSGNSRSDTATVENKTYCGTGIGSAVAKMSVNIRNTSNTGGTVLSTATKGTAVEVLEILSNGWYKIVWPGASCGYAYTSNVGGKYYTYTANSSATANTASAAASYVVGDKVIVNGKIYANGNGGTAISKLNSTMYVTELVSSSRYKYYIGLAAKKGGTRQGWANPDVLTKA